MRVLFVQGIRCISPAAPVLVTAQVKINLVNADSVVGRKILGILILKGDVFQTIKVRKMGKRQKFYLNFC